MSAQLLFIRVLVVTSLFVALPASAAEWKSYFVNAVGVDFSIDVSSVSHLKNGDIRAWQKQQPKDGDGFIYLLEVDCKGRKHIVRSITPIKKTIKNLQMIPTMLSLYGGWDYFEPNDLDEATYSEWCDSHVHK